MNFEIDVNAMLSTLPVMLYGMLGGLLVMLIIAVLLSGLYLVGRRNNRAE